MREARGKGEGRGEWGGQVGGVVLNSENQSRAKNVPSITSARYSHGAVRVGSHTNVLC